MITGDFWHRNATDMANCSGIMANCILRLMLQMIFISYGCEFEHFKSGTRNNTWSYDNIYEDNEYTFGVINNIFLQRYHLHHVCLCVVAIRTSVSIVKKYLLCGTFEILQLKSVNNKTGIRLITRVEWKHSTWWKYSKVIMAEEWHEHNIKLRTQIHNCFSQYINIHSAKASFTSYSIYIQMFRYVLRISTFG